MTYEARGISNAEMATSWRMLGEVLDRFANVMDGLSVDDLNWRPTAPETNSIYALATHTLGNVRWTVIEILGGQPADRDRDAEFQSAADASNVPIPTWDSVQAELEHVLAAMPADAMDRTYLHPVFGPCTGREVMVVMIRHAAEHLGHAGLTRDMVKAAAGA